LLDSAWREYSAGPLQRENFELPLVCRTDPDLWQLRFQEFPDGGHDTLDLNGAEIAAKQELVDLIGAVRVEAAMARRLFPPIDREIYRRVPECRDYTRPPAGLQLHYDDWGRLQVRMGRYGRAITFAQHFVPIVRQLPGM
jgi:hypothetical protein